MVSSAQTGAEALMCADDVTHYFDGAERRTAPFHDWTCDRSTGDAGNNISFLVPLDDKQQVRLNLGTVALEASAAPSCEHHDVGMRTTLTLDNDLARELKEEALRAGRSFKSVVNEVLRRGLAAGHAPGKRPRRFRVRPSACGLRAEVDLLKLNQLVDELEIDRAGALVIRDR